MCLKTLILPLVRGYHPMETCFRGTESNKAKEIEKCVKAINQLTNNWFYSLPNKKLSPQIRKHAIEKMDYSNNARSRLKLLAAIDRRIQNMQNIIKKCSAKKT